MIALHCYRASFDKLRMRKIETRICQMPQRKVLILSLSKPHPEPVEGRTAILLPQPANTRFKKAAISAIALSASLMTPPMLRKAWIWPG